MCRRLLNPTDRNALDSTCCRGICEVTSALSRSVASTTTGLKRISATRRILLTSESVYLKNAEASSNLAEYFNLPKPIIFQSKIRPIETGRWNWCDFYSLRTDPVSSAVFAWTRVSLLAPEWRCNLSSRRGSEFECRLRNWRAGLIRIGRDDPVPVWL